ncbi:MAG: hypothetical protein JEY97_04370 [Bacteroidales bacterium]|nr:hypothetical protein [Bacteroidales bacterium]
MEKDINNRDDCLKNLIKKSTNEKPSIDFTEKIMQKIEAGIETESIENYEKSYQKWWWLLVVISTVTLFSFLLMFDWSFLNFQIEKPNLDQINTIIPDIQKFFQSVMGLLSNLKFSSISIIILGTIIMLVFIDKFIKRYSVDKKYVF